MKDRTISVTEFKAKCTSILDEVDTQGLRVTVTRRGRPVAVVERPQPETPRKSLMGRWAGKLIITGDIIAPLEGWESVDPD